VAAFGYHAGFAGAALGLDVWSHQQIGDGAKYPTVKPYPNEDELISYIKQRLDKSGKYTVLFIKY
jgi:saccharopine dehydrogenase (NAD+, L-lysine-forming)